MAVSPEVLKNQGQDPFPVNVHILPSSGFFGFSVSHKDTIIPQL